MTDDFIKSLQNDWRSQPAATTTTLRRLRCNRWTPHVMLALEMLGCTLALLTGIWFAWIAIHTEEHKLLFTLSACIMLIASPLLGVAIVVARRASLAWDEETPVTLLRTGVRRAEASLQAIRLGRLHVVVIAAFVMTLWIVEALGFMHERAFLSFYTVLCLAFSSASWLWLAWREGRVRSERNACIRLLRALQVDDEIETTSSATS